MICSILDLELKTKDAWSVQTRACRVGRSLLIELRYRKSTLPYYGASVMPIVKRPFLHLLGQTIMVI
jgi:hypothetical protein